MKLPPLSFVVLDTETTGFVPRANRVIEFAAIRIENGKIASEYEQLFKIPTEIPQTVQVLTRIKNDDLEGKSEFSEKQNEMMEFIGEGTLIIGQNINFDIGMLKGEGIDLSEHPKLDTAMIASLVFPELRSYSLGYVSKILKLKHEPVHRAMGDVNATLELLGKCWERLLELPPELFEVAKIIMSKSSPGYHMLFDSLPEPKRKKTPKWFRVPKPKLSSSAHVTPLAEAIFEKPAIGTVSLVEEPMSPTTMQQLLDAAVPKENTTHWIAVKNLEAALRRLTIPEGVRVLQPPWNLYDMESATTFAAQDEFTADEGSLAVKLAWYEPKTIRDFPIHGEEKSVWNGKLSCTDESDLYTKQFDDLPGVVLLDHRQLLAFLGNPKHKAHEALNDSAHIIVDDASMLEDTATKAYSWYCKLDDIRAGSEGNEDLTSFTDAVQIWIEKVREGQDNHPVTRAMLQTPEVSGLKDRLSGILNSAEFAIPIKKQLENLDSMLDHNKVHDRIAWIEIRQNGSQSLQSVPEFVNEVLNENLLSKFSTTLLIPSKSSETLTEALSKSLQKTLSVSSDTDLDLPSITFSPDKSIETFLVKPQGDKQIILLPSRRMIEDAFIKYTEELESKGTTLICQNLSGGLERMQAEFTVAKTPCIWLLTPWTYEGVTLPPEMVDQLIIQRLPFDYPSHPTFAKRSEHYKNSFEEYSIPRLEHRIFRLLRTFCRHRTLDGSVIVLDDRLDKKAYGKRIKSYIEDLARSEKVVKPDRRKSKKKVMEIHEDQLSMF
ncbi:MAG: exonuclease domain-containing protein [Candidatus Peribacteraceae bacterium]|nr:exonuclease domain-containing protein [Candidatus Peribacteraceae bacterium]HCI04127.1 hypothetical protein [Candidatus Peribacteria bacterium]